MTTATIPGTLKDIVATAERLGYKVIRTSDVASYKNKHLQIAWVANDTHELMLCATYPPRPFMPELYSQDARTQGRMLTMHMTKVAEYKQKFFCEVRSDDGLIDKTRLTKSTQKIEEALRFYA
tara:strand:+ start:2409 stop:2777 length:369 start_codon:yes stop_codon:yes gene_type:complete